MKFDVWHGVVWLCKRLDEVKKDFSCASNATILGNVSIGEGSSVWYNAVIRSEAEMIEIGQETNIQDQCVLHTDRGFPLKIGNRVTIGHGAIVHGCAIEDEVLIGMGAIILNGACIGSHSIIGAGCVVPENMVIPQKSVVVGVPAKIIKKTSESQVSDILSNADHYVKLSKKLD
ncbi:MAG: gamma carbonic anhydrase family protein [Holdemanella biformis]|nr:gamma carbonic anhydrase family protein [Holdemanella biformis]